MDDWVEGSARDARRQRAGVGSRLVADAAHDGYAVVLQVVLEPSRVVLDGAKLPWVQFALDDEGDELGAVVRRQRRLLYKRHAQECLKCR